MKKRKRERLNQTKEKSRMEWERIKALQEEDKGRVGEAPMSREQISDDGIFGTLVTHFPDDEYGCEKVFGLSRR
jgi:hypothetical protein